MTTRRPAPGATYLAVLVLLLAAAAPTRCRSNAADDVIAASFVGDARRPFEHLARDPDTGALYVGAVNALYRLDANLTRHEAATTGPRDDDVGCSLGRPCATGVPTDNHNKVLVVDAARGRLVVCGSVAHGVCDVRPLAAISSVARAAPTTPVAANNASAPTVAFLAPGPRGRSVLVVGATVATHDGGAAAAPTTSAYWDSVKAVASRTLEDDGDPATSDLFRFVAKDAVSSLGTFVGFRSGTGSHRLTYPILYRSGFSAGGFSYLTTVQRATLDPGAPYVSKVARVCEADVEYRSFSEARLVCAAPPGDDAGGDYDVLQAATSGRIGRDLAADLGLTPQDEVLVGVFARARSDDGGGAPSWEPSGDSALCLYRLLDVERTFATNERKCRDGYGSSIYWTGTMQDCVK
ncbi:PREDICTED: plexin-A2-like, partial [Priapulus caudatus]|uniref:Plexin-A2-like n=1 Tax=Priapulus caudatus TaxID=37621 RepID=A0ABM1F478_PRICU